MPRSGRVRTLEFRPAVWPLSTFTPSVSTPQPSGTTIRTPPFPVRTMSVTGANALAWMAFRMIVPPPEACVGVPVSHGLPR